MTLLILKHVPIGPAHLQDPLFFVLVHTGAAQTVAYRQLKLVCTTRKQDQTSIINIKLKKKEEV